MSTMTLPELMTIMRECAGADEAATDATDPGGHTFEELGYDSLALMETASRVSREYQVSIPDDDLAAAQTPGALLALVNDRLSAAAAAR